MATPDGPRPENLPPNYNPNALSNNMQNLQINQQQSSNLGGSTPRPNATPFGQHPPPFARSRPGAPPPGAFPRGFVPPNLMSTRPTGPPLPDVLSRPGPFLPSHMSSEPTMPTHMRTWSPVSNVPPAPASGMIQNGPQFPPVIGGVTRPSVGPPQSPTFLSSEPSSQPPQMYPGSPSTMGQPAPPGPFLASHLSSEPTIPTHMSSSNPISIGPLTPASGMIQNGPRFPPVMNNMPRLPVGPPHTPTLFSQPPQMHPSFSTPPHGALSTMGLESPLLSAPPQYIPPPPGPIPFSAPVQGSFQSSLYSYGVQTWPPQQQQVVSPLPSAGPMQQQPQMYGMPPPPLPATGRIQQQQEQMFGMPPPPLPNQSMILNQTEQSTIDSNQLPRPAQSSAVILHETRQDNQANPPPPATSNYIVKDAGNCSPRYLRCTINQIPCTVDLLSTSAMQFALLVQPLALPHPSEDPIGVVDFRESGPVRCSRCKGYINPFMKFVNQGKHFICNFCGFTDETPSDYFCNLGPDGRRRDANERPELCRGTVEFVASTEYMVRDPMPAVFFFLVDVSMNAIQTGATAAACSAINQCLEDLPEGPRTMVGIATFDSTIHFYNIKRAQQQLSMLIVPDIQDVYTPLQSDVVVQLAECRQHLEILLESIPTTFQNNRTADSAFGAAVKAAFLAVKITGGKLLVFQSVLPSIGIGSLSAREAEGRSNVSEGEKEANKLLQPVDKTLKPMAIEFAEHQVCVDLFITTQTYVDIASLSIVPRTTGGQVYYYYPFSALCDSAKLYNDLRWNVTRPQGCEAVMRVRCSQGIQVQDYFGNFCKRNPTDVDLPAIDCDKTIMVSLKHDDKLQEGTECAFQCALCYTTVYGQRRIRVSTLSLPCTNVLSNLFCFADVDTQFACILKQVANEVPSVPLAQVRDQVTNVCTNIFHAYRKHCASVSTSGQLRLPEALKVLPIYALALIKSSGLRSDGRIDERSSWINYVSPLPTPLVIPLVYPRMISIHDLEEKEMDDSVIPAHIPLSSEHITDEGVYLLENGEDCLIYIGTSVQPNILQQLFSISSVEEISNQFILEQYDNPLSKKLNAVINEIRRQRCSYLRLKLCRKGDPSGSTFFSYMIEDRTPTGHSYGDYLESLEEANRAEDIIQPNVSDRYRNLSQNS